MATQAESLNDVLRWEMTAVDQQFIHVLALRQWGDDETAAGAPDRRTRPPTTFPPLSVASKPR